MPTHPTNGHFLRILRLLSLPGGVVVQPEYEKYRIPYIITFAALAFVGFAGVAGALFTPDARQLQVMEAAHDFSIAFNVIGIFVVQQLLRTRLINLYVDIEREYLGNLHFATLADSMSVDMIRKGLWVIIWLFTVMIIPPMLLIMVTDVDIGDIRALVFPVWVPFRIDTTWKYLLIMAVEITISWIACSVFFCSVGIISCYLVAVRCNYRILAENIEACFQSDRDVLMIRHDFRAVIMKHRDLMRFTAKVIHVVLYIAQMMAMTFFTGVILLTSILLKASNERIYCMKLIADTGSVFVTFFICCYIGEELEDLNRRINERVYRARWYCQDIRIQKLILLFMIQNERRFGLRIFNLYKMSLNLFLNALKNCYSAIQILTA